MPNIGQAIKGYIARALPVAGPETTEFESRAGVYGESYVNSLVPTKHLLADEGSYFVTTNPTPGTALKGAGGAPPTSFVSTTPFIIVRNNAPASAPTKRVYLDYIKFMVDLAASNALPTAATSVEAVAKIDTGPRVPTGTFSTLTPVNPNADSIAQSAALVYTFSSAALTAPAESAARLVGRARIKNGIPISLDEYVIAFGSVDGHGAVQGATALAKNTTNMPPIILGPQQFALIYLYLPSGATNPLAFELEMGHWER